jgi:hypothetical protein
MYERPPAWTLKYERSRQHLRGACCFFTAVYVSCWKDMTANTKKTQRNCWRWSYAPVDVCITPFGSFLARTPCHLLPSCRQRCSSAPRAHVVCSRLRPDSRTPPGPFFRSRARSCSSRRNEAYGVATTGSFASSSSPPVSSAPGSPHRRRINRQCRDLAPVSQSRNA